MPEPLTIERIKEARAGGVYPWSHLSNPFVVEQTAESVMDFLLEQLARWKSAIEGLTPSGSEYVNDPEACAAAIRKRCQYPKMVIELREQLAEKDAELIKIKSRILNWLASRCDYGPPCGRCTYCAVAKNLEPMLGEKL